MPQFAEPASVQARHGGTRPDPRSHGRPVPLARRAGQAAAQVARLARCLAFVSLVAFLLPAPSLAQSASWIACGPYGGQVLALGASSNWSAERVIFAGTASNGLFSSNDGGGSWKPVPQMPSGVPISSVAVSPAFGEDRTLFVSTTGKGIFKSWDGGTTWFLWSEGLTSLSVSQVALSPAFDADQTCLAATNRGVHRSISAGKRWEQVGPQIATQSAAFASASGEVWDAFAGTVLGVYASRDGGETWNPTSLTAGPVISLALSPRYLQDRTLLAGTVAGAYLSRDGGGAWEGPFLATEVIHAALFSPGYAQDRTFFLGTTEGPRVSRDDGASWETAGDVSDTPHCLVAVAGDGGASLLYMGTDRSGVLESADGGDTWEPRNLGLANVPLDAVAVSPRYTRDRAVYVGGPRGMWRSLDDGLTWEYASPGDVAVNALRVARPGGGPSAVYAGTDEGLYLSPDGGLTWESNPGGLSALHVQDIAIGAQGEVWVATGEGRVHYSASGHASWEDRSSGLPSAPVKAIEWLGTWGERTYLLVGTWGAGVYTSADGGRSWRLATTGPETPHLRDLASAVGYGDILWSLAATTAGVCYSADKGDAWDCRGLLGLDISGIAMHPQYALRPDLYAGGREDGVYRSLNGGLTWSSLNQGLGVRNIRGLAVAMDDATDVVLFAATTSGLWRYGGQQRSPEPDTMVIMLPLLYRNGSGPVGAASPLAEEGSASPDALRAESVRRGAGAR